MSEKEIVIYPASSWRNPHQPHVVSALRANGHDAYDFRHPEPGDNGFAWKQCDPTLPDTGWSITDLARVLDHPVARRGFRFDYTAMQRATAGMLILPAGRSAHLEIGWLMARLPGRVCILSYDPIEPELMYLCGEGESRSPFMFDKMEDVLTFLRNLPPLAPPATLDEIIERHVLDTMRAFGGNKTHAAKALGIDRRSLYRHLYRNARKGEGDLS